MGTISFSPRRRLRSRSWIAQQAEPDQPLTGITWGLTSILDNDTASSVPNGVMATLLFKDDGTVQIY